MKKIILTLLLFPVFAIACPDLQGDYMCQNDEGSDIVQLRQSDHNGVTYYFDAREPNNGFLADGELKRLPDDDYARNQFIRATCSSTTLTIDSTGDLYRDNVKSGSYIVVNEAFKNGQNLVVNSTFTMIIPGEPQNVQKNDSTCTPMN